MDIIVTRMGQLIQTSLAGRLRLKCNFLVVQGVRISMSGGMKFRFLERTDLRRCHSLIRSCGKRFHLS